MEGMLQETEKAGNGLMPPVLTQTANALGDLLRDHKGADVVVLDLREQGAWTDFFVIATATSSTHMDGLDRHIKEFCKKREIEILRRSRKPDALEDEWRIIDLGPIVIHLMNHRTRDFYEIERLYHFASTNNPSFRFKSADN